MALAGSVSRSPRERFSKRRRARRSPWRAARSSRGGRRSGTHAAPLCGPSPEGRCERCSAPDPAALTRTPDAPRPTAPERASPAECRTPARSSARQASVPAKASSPTVARYLASSTGWTPTRTAATVPAGAPLELPPPVTGLGALSPPPPPQRNGRAHRVRPDRPGRRPRRAVRAVRSPHNKQEASRPPPGSSPSTPARRPPSVYGALIGEDEAPAAPLFADGTIVMTRDCDDARTEGLAGVEAVVHDACYDSDQSDPLLRRW